jgi:hypothetical protein
MANYRAAIEHADGAAMLDRCLIADQTLSSAEWTIDEGRRHEHGQPRRLSLARWRNSVQRFNWTG